MRLASVEPPPAKMTEKRQSQTSSINADLIFVPFKARNDCTTPASSRDARSYAARNGRWMCRSEREKRLENFCVTAIESFKEQAKDQGSRSASAGFTREHHQVMPRDQHMCKGTPGVSTTVHGEDQPRQELGFTQNLKCTASSSLEPSLGEIDPFDSLPIPAIHLFTLMSNRAASVAGEPIFSVNILDPLRSIATVFSGNGLTDGAVCTGLTLSVSLAVNDWKWNEQCAAYAKDLIRFINEKITDPEANKDEMTIGAILLLASVEARHGNSAAVDWHMNGIGRILQLRKDVNKPLSTGIERALFWQDLYAQELVQIPRHFCLEMFPDLYWERDHSSSSIFHLPPGLEQSNDILSLNFRTVLEDLYGVSLYVYDHSSDCESMETTAKIQMDNQQAWIESRLVNLQQEAQTLGLVAECIRLAALICAYCLDMSTWASNFIPSQLSQKLLLNLQHTISFCLWEARTGVFLWLILVGFHAARPELKAQYRQFVYALSIGFTQRAETTSGLVQSVMKNFIWPKNAPLSLMIDLYRCTG